MLSIFRTNQIFANILLIIYATITHISLFIVPSSWKPQNSGILSDWVYSWLDVPSILASIFSILLVSFQATIINFICIRYRMAAEINLFPGLFYILIVSLIPDFLHLSPILLGNTFLIFALYQLLETYKKYSAADNIYNVGLWIGVASLFYFSFAIFFLLGWLGLNILRAFKLKERIILLIGFLSPYLLTFTYAFWNDNSLAFLQKQGFSNLAFLDFATIEPLTLYVGGGTILLLLLTALLSSRTYSLKKNIRVQKNINILFLCLFISVFSLLFQSNIGIEHLLLLSVPLGIFISFNFTRMSNQMAESLHLIWLTLVLFWQFFPLFQF